MDVILAQNSGLAHRSLFGVGILGIFYVLQNILLSSVCSLTCQVDQEVLQVRRARRVRKYRQESLIKYSREALDTL